MLIFNFENRHLKFFLLGNALWTCPPLCLQRKQTSYCKLLNRIGLPSLENRHLAKIVSTVFNVINNEHAPRSIKDLIGLRNNNYNLRGSDILKQPKASTTTYGLKSWRFMAPKLWNLLPDSSRINQTLKAFKNVIRTLGLSGLLWWWFCTHFIHFIFYLWPYYLRV